MGMFAVLGARCAAPRWSARQLIRWQCSASSKVITIDRSKAAGHLGDNRRDHPDEGSEVSTPAGGLVGKLATQMRVRGPMSIKEFMTAALTHPDRKSVV